MRGRAIWDSDQIAGQAIGYNPRTGTGVYTKRYATEDSGWRESLVTRNGEWLHTQTERQGNTATTEFETSRGTSGTVDREYTDGQLTGSGEISRGSPENSPVKMAAPAVTFATPKVISTPVKMARSISVKTVSGTNMAAMTGNPSNANRAAPGILT